MLHELQPHTPRIYSKPRVGRSGKRGTTSGRGQKGQKARAGRRIRPAIRDYIQRIPKLRGHRNVKRAVKMPVVNIDDLEKRSEEIITAATFGSVVKILGMGTLTRKITVVGLPVSKSARAAIEKAGGKITKT